MSNKSNEYQLFQDDLDFDEEEVENVPIYFKQCNTMKKTQRSTMFVDLDHLFQWDKTKKFKEMLLNETFR